jgi:hypothetical protein
VVEVAEVTSVAPTVGYEPKSTPFSLTPALAVLAVASKASSETSARLKTRVFSLEGII